MIHIYRVWILKQIFFFLVERLFIYKDLFQRIPLQNKPSVLNFLKHFTNK